MASWSDEYDGAGPDYDDGGLSLEELLARYSFTSAVSDAVVDPLGVMGAPSNMRPDEHLHAQYRRGTYAPYRPVETLGREEVAEWFG